MIGARDLLFDWGGRLGGQGNWASVVLAALSWFVYL